MLCKISEQECQALSSTVFKDVDISFCSELDQLLKSCVHQVVSPKSVENLDPDSRSGNDAAPTVQPLMRSISDSSPPQNIFPLFRNASVPVSASSRLEGKTQTTASVGVETYGPVSSDSSQSKAVPSEGLDTYGPMPSQDFEQPAPCAPVNVCALPLITPPSVDSVYEDMYAALVKEDFIPASSISELGSCEQQIPAADDDAYGLLTVSSILPASVVVANEIMQGYAARAEKELNQQKALLAASKASESKQGYGRLGVIDTVSPSNSDLSLSMQFDYNSCELEDRLMDFTSRIFCIWRLRIQTLSTDTVNFIFVLTKSLPESFTRMLFCRFKVVAWTLMRCCIALCFLLRSTGRSVAVIYCLQVNLCHRIQSLLWFPL